MKRLAIVFIFQFAFTLFVKAQPYHFRHYQVEQGLSYSSVFCILQDTKGFLWFGTKNGLNRFDGYNFKIFRNDAADRKSIGNNVIRSIAEDTRGRLWIGTSSGLFQYRDTTEVFDPVGGTANRSVWNVQSDGKGSVVFIANFVIYRYDQDKKKIHALSDRQDFDATSLCFDKKGGLWASSRSGKLMRYDQSNNTFVGFDVFANSPKVSSYWIDRIYATQSNSILIGTSHQGVKLFDINDLSYKDILSRNLDQTSIFVKNFLHYKEDEYWIATESGIFIYNLGTGKYTNLKKSFSDPYAISDNAVYALAKDREGGMWVGTYFGGVDYYPNPFTSFDKFFSQGSGKSKSLSGDAVREICKDQYGNLWIGTEDAGLNKLPAGQTQVVTYAPDGSSAHISHTNIHALMAMKNELWVGTFEQGLDVLDIPTGKVIRHYNGGSQAGALGSNFIECLYRTRSGQILVGTASGLYRYNPSSDDFSLEKNIPSNLFVVNISEDESGTIWVGGIRQGLFFYNPATGKKGVYKHDTTVSSSLSNDFINHIFISADQTHWVATEYGLNKLDVKKGIFKRYGVKDGFPSDIFYRIEEDRQHNLWISTAKGLSCFNPNTGQVRTYTKANGLLNDQFNYNSSFRDESGELYFGSVNGLIAFNPAEFKKNTVVPAVQITGFQVFNQDLKINAHGSPLNQSITFTEELKLAYDQSTFSIDFAALVYTDYETAEYAYKLEGVDQDFTYLKENRRVFYTKLSPGTYTFLIKAANSSGVWNEIPKKLVIRISPPFWLSIWAYIVYILVFTAGFYVLILYFYRKVKQRNKRKLEQLKNQKERELYEAKIEFFTQITHEIRTPLTLIKGPIETILKNYQSEPELLNYLHTMERNADRLLHLTNQLLDFRKIESREYPIYYIRTNISALVKENFERFKTAMEEKQLKYHLQIQEDEFFAVSDPEALTKILSNLLSNAIKYAKNEISVSLIVAGEAYEVVVSNDGYLIPDEMKERIFESFVRLEATSSEVGTGIGLALARSLAILHGGSLNVDSDDQLNVFVLRLPLNQTTDVEQQTEPPFIENIDQEFISEEPANASKEEKPTLLLVDDNKDIVDYLAKELGNYYYCISASNGQQALMLLKEQTVQLVLSDVMMPLMDGFELCRMIKTDVTISHIPVILLTAKNTSQSRVEGLETGADAYMEKPFSPEHLLAQIQSLLNNRNKLRDYFASSPLVHLKSIAHSKPDEILLEKLNAYIVENLSDKNLDVEQLADTMNMSRATFYRKVKSVSNLSPNELINITRLKKAAELLLTTDYKIQHIADLTGFASQAQFGRSFTKQFGITPSGYAQRERHKEE